MLEDDFKFFKDNHDAIFSEYPNKHVVIKGKEVLYSDDTFEGALTKAINGGLEVGTFLIQHCSAGDEGYTQTFHSRVIFA